MDCSRPGFSVHYHLLEVAQTHVHKVGDAIQPSHSLSSLLLLPSVFPSIRLFFSESALHIRWPDIGASAPASVLPVNIQDWFPLGWTGCISLGLSRVFSNTTVQKHQFFYTRLLYGSTLTSIHVLGFGAKLCLTVCDPMKCSPPGSSVHGDSPGKNIGVGCHPSLRGSSQPRDRTQVSHIAGRFFTNWATKEAIHAFWKNHSF